MLIELETIKNHLNIDSSFNDDDNYIMQLEEVAEAIVEKHIDRTLEDIIGEEGEVPKPLLQAILLFIANLSNIFSTSCNNYYIFIYFSYSFYNILYFI